MILLLPQSSYSGRLWNLHDKVSCRSLGQHGSCCGAARILWSSILYALSGVSLFVLPHPPQRHWKRASTKEVIYLNTFLLARGRSLALSTHSSWLCQYRSCYMRSREGGQEKVSMSCYIGYGQPLIITIKPVVEPQGRHRSLLQQLAATWQQWVVVNMNNHMANTSLLSTSHSHRWEIFLISSDICSDLSILKWIRRLY